MSMVGSSSYLLLARDERGAPYAVEVVDAEAWEPALEEPPERERADVRVVRLGGAAPSALPRWLAVEGDARPRRSPPPLPSTTASAERPGRGAARDRGGLRVAEAAAAYDARPAGASAGASARGDPGGTSELALAQRLWPWSPWHAEPGASLAEFLAAGAAALRHPGPLPAEPARQLEALARFAGGRRALATLESLRADALERWLLRCFGDPDAFAEAILLARIEAAGDEQTAALLRFLRDAEVPEGPRYAELALDRRVLREQASPWLHPRAHAEGREAAAQDAARDAERAAFAAALRAVHAWRERYLAAYRAHYRAMLERADALRGELRAVAARASALARLQRLRPLASEEAARALRRHAASLRALDALPDEPAPGEPTTGGVALGAEPAAFAAASEAAAAADAALEGCRRALAAALAGLALDRAGVPGLDRLLQAIAASELDGLDRVLDERLAAHIEALLARPPEPLLTRLARLHPIVTAVTRDAAVADFARLLEQEIAASPGASAMLAEGAPVAAPGG